MAYATLEEMLKRFGETELIRLTDNEEPYLGQINLDKLNAAMDAANSEIDAYLAMGMSVPLINPPKLIILLACDMARYHASLAHSRVSERDEVRYNAAIKTLQKIADGKLKTGATSAQDNLTGNGTAQMSSGRDTVFGNGGW